MTPSDGAGFTATNRLDKVSEVGIVLKGLDGLLGTAGGALLLPSLGVARIKPANRTWRASRASPRERCPAPVDACKPPKSESVTRDGNNFTR